MYKIIGGDGNEYGPVSLETLRQWMAEGRVSRETQVCVESGAWTPLGQMPELAALLAQAEPRASAAPPPFAPAMRQEIFEGDYQLDLGGCISRGWKLLQANFGVLFGGFMIYMVVGLGVGLLAEIQVIGFVFKLASWLITGPLMGGLLYLSLRVIRGEAALAGDVFEGFRRQGGQLVLGQIVTSLLMGLCLLPALIVGVIVLFPTFSNLATMDMASLRQWVESLPLQLLFGVCGFALLCLIPMLFLQVNWMFTLPLILDRELDFWTAMKTSWRRVTQHWWQVFSLVVLVGLVNVLGLCLCGVGLLVTVPIGLAATMYAYETIFSGNTAKTP